jgi:hypothetical protein
MTMGFHYEDRPPQLWLDELYNFQVPRLWDVKLNASQRNNLATRAKQQLKDWRLAMRDQIRKIEARYSKEQLKESRLMVAPYRKLDDLATELIDAIADLETKLAAGRPVPQGFEIGEKIFGSLPTGRWFFGSLKDAKRWEEFEKLERRYYGLQEEYQNMGLEMKEAFARVKDEQNELSKTGKRYKRLKGFFQLGLRLFIVILAVVFCLLVGGFVFNHPEPLIEGGISNQAFAGVMLILGVIGSIIAIVLARRRRRAISDLQDDISTMRQNLERSKKEALRQKKLFYPTQQTFKEVSREYKKMWQTFASQ